MTTDEFNPQTSAGVQAGSDVSAHAGRITYVIASSVAATVAVGGLVFLLWRLMEGTSVRTEVVMGITSILGVATIAVLLFVMAIGFSAMGLADRRHALGLPEGSIRAMIAIFLIIIFLIFGILMFRAVGFGFYGPMTNGLTADQLEDVATTIGNRIGRIEAGKVEGTYNVQLFIPLTQDGTQLAMQMLTILGTLVTAVSAFYFGASTSREGTEAAAKKVAETLVAADALPSLMQARREVVLAQAAGAAVEHAAQGAGPRQSGRAPEADTPGALGTPSQKEAGGDATNKR